MFAKATSGDKTNNRRFSMCSIDKMTGVMGKKGWCPDEKCCFIGEFLWGIFNGVAQNTGLYRAREKAYTRAHTHTQACAGTHTHTHTHTHHGLNWSPKPNLNIDLTIHASRDSLPALRVILHIIIVRLKLS